MTFANLIDRWESMASFASAVGAPYQRARKWRERNSIPPVHWPEIVRASKERGFDDVTLEAMAEMATATEPSHAAA